MDARNILSRRAAIKGTVAIAAALPLPALASPASDERLHQLMAEWQAAYDAASDGAHPEGLPDPLMNRLYEIEGEAAAIRPTTLEGLAIKLLLLTNYGEFDLDDFRRALLAEAEAITGYAPPATFKRSA